MVTLHLKFSNVQDTQIHKFEEREFDFIDYGERLGRQISTEQEVKRLVDVLESHISTDFCEALYKELYARKVMEML